MLNRAAPIVVVGSDPAEAHQIAGWLSGAGLGTISTARTCNEAIFMVGRARPDLLIMDETISDGAEQRLLQHIGIGDPNYNPAVVRLIGPHAPDPVAHPADCQSSRKPTHIIRKPLAAHDLVVRIGALMDRPDLIGKFDQSRDQTAQHLAAARQMQIGLLPNAGELQILQDFCGVGVSGLYRSGEEIGGDLWGICTLDEAASPWRSPTSSVTA